MPGDKRQNIKGVTVSADEVHPVSTEDAEWVERVCSGDQGAFGSLVEKYQDRVFNACWRVCGHLEDARDATQEAFLKVYENLSTFRRESSFYTWLFRIAVNQALTLRRKSGSRKEVSYDQASNPIGTQATVLAQRVQRAESQEPAVSKSSEVHGRVVKALFQLDDDHRAVIVLRDIEGMDYQQMSTILEVPVGTVKSRLHRARMDLRKMILDSK